MIKLKSIEEFLKERTEDKVIYVKDELWVTYGQGSGTTAQFKDLKSFITNKDGDKNYDSLTNKIVKWSEVNKPLKSKGNSKLFGIEEYPVVSTGKKYECWGGDVKPLRNLYMIVDNNGSITVVNLFQNKNEAMNWMKSLA
jgi:hypothetical protein